MSTEGIPQNKYYHDAIIGQPTNEALTGSVRTSTSDAASNLDITLNNGDPTIIPFTIPGETVLLGFYRARKTGVHAVNLILQIATAGGATVQDRWNKNIRLTAEVLDIQTGQLNTQIVNNPKVILEAVPLTTLVGDETPKIYAQAFPIYMMEGNELRISAQDISFLNHLNTILATIGKERSIQILEIDTIISSTQIKPSDVFRSVEGVNDMPGPWKTNWGYTATATGWEAQSLPSKTIYKGNQIDFVKSNETRLGETIVDSISTDATTKFVVPFNNNSAYAPEVIPVPIELNTSFVAGTFKTPQRGLYLLQSKMRITNAGLTNTSLRYGIRQKGAAVDKYFFNGLNFFTFTQCNPHCFTPSTYINYNVANEELEIWWGAQNGSNVTIQDAYCLAYLIIPYD
jgi:hypothetical protein